MKALCQSSHPNLVDYIDDGSIVTNSVTYFIDMELCDINLEDFINGAGIVTGLHCLPKWDKNNPDLFLIIAILQQLLNGLAFIHKQDKVHRDLKPTKGKSYCMFCMFHPSDWAFMNPIFIKGIWE